MDDEIIEKISKEIIEILKSYKIEEISQDEVSQYINGEMSLMKDYLSIKIMDADSNYGEENGIYIVLLPAPAMLIVKNSIKKKIDITQDIAMKLLVLTYCVRFMSLLKGDIKEEIINLTIEINNIINKLRTEC